MFHQAALHNAMSRADPAARRGWSLKETDWWGGRHRYFVSPGDATRKDKQANRSTPVHEPILLISMVLLVAHATPSPTTLR